MFRPRSRMLTLIAALATVSLIAVGCGDDDSTLVATPPTNGVDPDTPILVVDHEDGFVTREMNFTRVPTLAVYANGQMIAMGAQIMIYPGPALPPLFEAQVTDAGLGRLIAAARDAGLAARDLDFGSPPVADVPTTVVTVTIDGTTYVHSIEALGFDDDPSLTGEQRQRRADLSAFLAQTSDMAALVGPDNISEDTRFEADRYRLWIRPADEVDEGVEIPEGEPSPTEVDWPVDEVELTSTDCLAVEGDAAEAVGSVFAEADQLTRFVDGGQVWVVLARPVLPHEETC